MQTDRFKAAISQAGVSDLYKLNLDRGGGPNGGQTHLGEGDPEAPEMVERYIRNSPLYHAGKVKTPLLLLHGKMDGTSEFPHALSMYRALIRAGKPAKLVAYDNNGHSISNLHVSGQYVEWFDKYLRSRPQS